MPVTIRYPNDHVYMKIPDADISQEMLNYSASKTKASMPSKTESAVLYRMVEVLMPVPRDVFSGYTWLSEDEARTEIANGWT